MKSSLGFGFIFIFLGCGILSLLFDVPNRYITREVQTQELAGEWRIKQESEERLQKFRDTFPDWPDLAPWKTIRLNNDGTCQVKLEIQWLPNYKDSPPEISHSEIPNDVLTNNILACSWEISTTNGITSEGNKDVPSVKISIEYPNNYSRTYNLYIYEENEDLILWNFIGDPDDFVPQDFVKTQN
ncbi:MAG: hypothetical protein IPP66_12825 [Anaerolineales bacterium]|nr:hypothetical protein [Anaerolineales bacterium]